MMLFDTLTYLPNDILTKVDRASMSNSLEVRVFLSKDLLNLSLSLPEKYKIGGKVVLKKILNEYLPKELIDFPKQGFGIPWKMD